MTGSAEQIVLSFKPGPSTGEVGVHSQRNLPISSMYSEYILERSVNLQTWETVGSPVNGGVGVSDEYLRIPGPTAGDQAFYRISANLKLAPMEGRLGDSVYGYATAFGREIQAVGQLPLAEFAAQFAPTNSYLPSISFDPTTAHYWDQFNLDPAVHNATNSSDPRLTDFRLNANEFAVFETNGFVVSQRLGTYSFADSFYRIYTDDLPVFVSADAALHAWHRSYVSMLEEVEESHLAPRMQGIIRGMSQLVPTLSAEASGTALENGVLDADLFLAVARSLITGTNYFGSLGQDALIQNTLEAITNLQVSKIPLFGAERTIDFSQFQVRGHYESSPLLQNYFRAMMWCSLSDFRFTGTGDNSLRQLSGAVALHLLMKDSGELKYWQNAERILQTFVGLSDSLNFPQLSDLLAAASIYSPANLPDAAALQNLQDRIMSGQVGVQNIRSGIFFSPFSRDQIKLPRAFSFMGQRFVLDSWALSKCVFDDIIWDSDGIPGFEDKVWRRVPSALDVAFSVLGNNDVVPDLVSRIGNTNGHPWRDGYPYQHNLAAVRNVVEQQEAGVWTNNIYNSWLACLRELSAPTTTAPYPEPMRTRAWAMKNVNTQLASWTQLRHDTVLYAKQPYTGNVLCSYPDGYVEPRPSFWRAMADMALRTKELMTTFPKSGTFTFEPSVAGQPSFTVAVGTIYTNRIEFLDHFAQTMSTLQQISEKQLAAQPLSTNETFFLQNLIEFQSQYSGVRTFSGWYPKLFYRNQRTLRSHTNPSDAWDALVTDVHTNPADPFMNDPGSILHQGVGNVHLLMIAADCGNGEKAVYAGPVLSHYEFELGPTTRKTDSQWKADLQAGNLPPAPEWTQGYLVP